ncbi:MAG: glycosyltransferase family 2 protein [Flavobacteriales bacterium]
MGAVYLDIDIKKISIVVPVYNGERTISQLFEEVKNTFESVNLSFQLIFVDDFSADGSWAIIKTLKEKYPSEVVAIRLAKNFGQHNATLCGFKYAEGDFIVTIDDDMENSPEDILKLLAHQKKTGSDLVYGVDNHKTSSFIKSTFRNIYILIARLLEGDDKMRGSSFRLMKISLAKEILKNARTFSFIDEFIHWYTSNVSSINLDKKKNERKKSRYSLISLSILTKELVFFNSVTPLRVVTIIGFLMASSNFIWGLIILYRKFILSISVQGYASIIVAILFSSGLIILSIGILAEYISKIIKISYNKPPFCEAEVL